MCTYCARMDKYFLFQVPKIIIKRCKGKPVEIKIKKNEKRTLKQDYFEVKHHSMKRRDRLMCTIYFI